MQPKRPELLLFCKPITSQQVVWIANYLRSWQSNQITVLDRLYKWANGVGLWNGLDSSYNGDTSATDMDPSTAAVDAGFEMLAADQGQISQAAALVSETLLAALSPPLSLTILRFCPAVSMDRKQPVLVPQRRWLPDLVPGNVVYCRERRCGDDACCSPCRSH